MYLLQLLCILVYGQLKLVQSVRGPGFLLTDVCRRMSGVCTVVVIVIVSDSDGVLCQRRFLLSEHFLGL